MANPQDDFSYERPLNNHYSRSIYPPNQQSRFSKALILLSSCLIGVGIGLNGGSHSSQGAFALHAQVVEPNPLIEIQQLLDAGQYPDAIETAEALLSEQETTWGAFEAAAVSLERTLNIRQQLWGTSHPLIAHALNNLGVLAHAQNDSPQAQDYVTQALNIANETLGSEHPDTQKIRGNQQRLSGSLSSTDELFVFGR